MTEHTHRFGIALDGPVENRPRDARRWVMDRCARLQLECASMNLPLLVSELVTNACVHGADPVTLRVELSRARMRVEVEDSVPDWPDLQSPTDRDPSGRGLLIVDSLSHVWGVEETVTGKTVWAEVFVEEPGEHALQKAGCA
jgi:anti-sigma regulatory factor (Ser/Thr protein kinase)